MNINMNDLNTLIYTLYYNNTEELKKLSITPGFIDLLKAPIEEWAGNKLYGMFPLSFTILYVKDYKKIELLLECKADPLLVDKQGYNAFQRLLTNEKQYDPQIYKKIYALIQNEAYPLVANASSHVKPLLYGFAWKQPENQDFLEITYSLKEFNLEGTLLGTKLSTVTKEGHSLTKGETLTPEQNHTINEALNYFGSIFRIKFINIEPSPKTMFFIRQDDLKKLKDENVTARTELLLNNEGEITQACIMLDSTFFKVINNTTHTTTTQIYYLLYKIIYHEIGHALGLKHPDNHYKNSDSLMVEECKNVPNGVCPRSLMPNDYDALKYIYQVNNDYMSKDNVYVINGTENFRDLKLIVDQDGEDTIDASLYEGNATIDLTKTDIYSNPKMNNIGFYSFFIAREVEIENVKGAKGNNSITDNSGNNEIDLSASKGNSEVKISQGNDTVILSSSGKDSIIFTSGSSGMKHVIGFNSEVDQIIFESYLIKPENIANENHSTVITIGNLKVLLENINVSYEELANMAGNINHVGSEEL